MKKLISILLCLLLLLTVFVGCDEKKPTGTPTEKPTETPTENPSEPTVKDLRDSVLYDGELYSYERIDGQYYIVLKDISKLPNLPEKYPPHYEGVAAIGVAPPWPCFDSFDELYNSIRYKGLDDYTLAYLYYYENPENSNKIRICDFHELYIPTFPDSLTNYQEVRWFGEMYIWSVKEAKEKNAVSVSMEKLTEDKYAALVKETLDFSAGKFFESTNAIGVKEYYYIENKSIGFSYVYEFEKNGAKYLAEEKYYSSKDTPKSVNVFIKNSQGGFMFNINGLSARPHYSWISAFGTELYKIQ